MSGYGGKASRPRDARAERAPYPGSSSPGGFVGRLVKGAEDFLDKALHALPVLGYFGLHPRANGLDISEEDNGMVVEEEPASAEPVEPRPRREGLAGAAVRAENGKGGNPFDAVFDRVQRMNDGGRGPWPAAPAPRRPDSVLAPTYKPAPKPLAPSALIRRPLEDAATAARPARQGPANGAAVRGLQGPWTPMRPVAPAAAADKRPAPGDFAPSDLGAPATAAGLTPLPQPLGAVAGPSVPIRGLRNVEVCPSTNLFARRIRRRVEATEDRGGAAAWPAAPAAAAAAAMAPPPTETAARILQSITSVNRDAHGAARAYVVPKGGYGISSLGPEPPIPTDTLMDAADVHHTKGGAAATPPASQSLPLVPPPAPFDGKAGRSEAEAGGPGGVARTSVFGFATAPQAPATAAPSLREKEKEKAAPAVAEAPAAPAPVASGWGADFLSKAAAAASKAAEAAKEEVAKAGGQIKAAPAAAAAAPAPAPVSSGWGSDFLAKAAAASSKATEAAKEEIAKASGAAAAPLAAAAGAPSVTLPGGKAPPAGTFTFGVAPGASTSVAPPPSFGLQPPAANGKPVADRGQEAAPKTAPSFGTTSEAQRAGAPAGPAGSGLFRPPFSFSTEAARDKDREPPASPIAFGAPRPDGGADAASQPAHLGLPSASDAAARAATDKASEPRFSFGTPGPRSSAEDRAARAAAALNGSAGASFGAAEPTFTFGKPKNGAVVPSFANGVTVKPAEMPSSAAEKPAAAPAPVASGWGADFLSKATAAASKAAEAAKEEVAKAGGQIKAAPAAAAAAPAPAPVSSGWGSDFLAKAAAASSKATEAAKEEIAKASGAAAAPLAAAAGAPSVTLPGGKAPPPAGSLSFGLAPGASAGPALTLAAPTASAPSSGPGFSFGAASAPKEVSGSEAPKSTAPLFGRPAEGPSRTDTTGTFGSLLDQPGARTGSDLAGADKQQALAPAPAANLFSFGGKPAAAPETAAPAPAAAPAPVSSGWGSDFLAKAAAASSKATEAAKEEIAKANGSGLAGSSPFGAAAGSTSAAPGAKPAAGLFSFGAQPSTTAATTAPAAGADQAPAATGNFVFGAGAASKLAEHPAPSQAPAPLSLNFGSIIPPAGGASMGASAATTPTGTSTDAAAALNPFVSDKSKVNAFGGAAPGAALFGNMASKPADQPAGAAQPMAFGGASQNQPPPPQISTAGPFAFGGGAAANASGALSAPSPSGSRSQSPFTSAGQGAAGAAMPFPQSSQGGFSLGAQPNPNPANPFGQQPQAPAPFGAAQGSTSNVPVFGQQQQAVNPFGSAASQPFGAAPQASAGFSPFGQAPQQPPQQPQPHAAFTFGAQQNANQGPSPFGQSSAAPFGSSASAFPQQAQQPFGGPSPFGGMQQQPQQAANPFGAGPSAAPFGAVQQQQPQVANPFGMAPSMGFGGGAPFGAQQPQQQQQMGMGGMGGAPFGGIAQGGQPFGTDPQPSGSQFSLGSGSSQQQPGAAQGRKIAKARRPGR